MFNIKCFGQYVSEELVLNDLFLPTVLVCTNIVYFTTEGGEVKLRHNLRL